jgi:hypothetical protein
VALLAALAPSLASGAGTAPPNSNLGKSACNLLTYAGTLTVVGQGHPVQVQSFLNACVVASCWQTYADPDTGAQKCHYGLGATLTLSRAKTTASALKFVHREIGKGYRRVKVKGADLAGIVSNPKGAGIVMAVGRTTALFALGATSDDNPNPIFSEDPTHITIAIVRDIAKELGRPGCPVHPGKCPSS